MKPEKSVPLCKDCVRYLQCFMSVTAFKRRSIRRCRSCGRVGLYGLFDLEN